MKLKNKVAKGQRFGKWIALENRQTGKTKVLVRCKCGLEKEVSASHLICSASRGCRKCRNVPSGNQSSAWKGQGQIPAKFFWRVWNGAKERGILFELNIIEAAEVFDKQNGKCALTGRHLTFGTRANNITESKYYENTTASLDRMDSTKGYIVGNVQWVHKSVNMAKYTLSQHEFIELCREVAEYIQ